MDITQLSIWPELEKLGFVTKPFPAAVGAVLQEGQISIEPTDANDYHITGKIKTPFYDTIYHKNYDGKVVAIRYLREQINLYSVEADILQTVQLMLK